MDSAGIRPGWRGLTLALGAAALAGPADSQISHRVHFAAGPIVMAWEDGAFSGRADTIRLRAPALPGLATDSERPVLTGQLAPVGARSPATRERRLQIASNTGFAIDLACPAPALPGHATVTVSVSADRPAAQIPGPAVTETPVRPGASASRIYTASVRTAARRGPVEAQAVEVAIRSHGGTDLSVCQIEISARP